MNLTDFQKQRINSLVDLANKLDALGLPEHIVYQAIQENPWFTKYYIDTAIEGIRSWLSQDILKEFVAHYPALSGTGQKIGIIAAGNVPFVGFHDVMVAFLSGHEVILKPSRQDRV